MGKGLDAWVADNAPPGNTVEAWFATRPDLKEQVLAGREPDENGRPKYSFPQIGAWLKDEHQFPFSYKSLGPWLRQ